jgi:hypothetical protein
MQPASTSAPEPILIPGPDSLPAAVPHLLGFHPSRSLVLVGFDPDTLRVQVTLRFDLPDPEVDPLRAADAWTSTFGALHRAGAARSIVLVYPGPDEDPWVAPWPHALPRGALVSAFADELTDAGLSPIDAVCVVGDRVRSYWCDSDICCPPEGRTVPWSESLAVEAEMVGLGSAPLASREELAATLHPRPLDDPFVELLAQTLPARRDRVHESDLDAARRSLAWMAERTGGDVLLDLDSFVDMVLVCARVRSRDLLLRALTVDAGPEARLAARVWLLEAVRSVPDEYVAPVASVLAVCAWLRGDGAAARVAVDRALDVDPAYSLAGLLSAALDAGTPPWTWQAMMADLSEAEILAGSHDRSETLVADYLDVPDEIDDPDNDLSDCERLDRYPSAFDDDEDDVLDDDDLDDDLG